MQEMRLGQKVAFGDKIQLLNSMSSQFVQADKAIALETSTALKVQLSKEEHGRNKGCWFQIMAGFRTRQEGGASIYNSKSIIAHH